MSEKTEKAKQLFLEGYNCSQAVLGAFCEELGLDFETAMRLSASFGAGMGRLREVCGAVSGGFMVAGLKFGGISPSDQVGKAEHYKRIQDMAARFTEKNGSIICRTLLEKKKEEKESHVPDKRTQEYYKQRPCLAIVEEMAGITEAMLNGTFYEKP